MTSINTNLSGSAYRGIYALSKINTAMSESLARVQTGNKILRASDDPSGLVTALELDGEINAARTQLDSNKETVSELNSVDDALTAMITHLQDMKSLLNEYDNTSDPDVQNSLEQTLTDKAGMIEDLADDTEFQAVTIMSQGADYNATVRYGPDSGDTVTITFKDMQEASLNLDADGTTDPADFDTAFANGVTTDQMRTQIDDALDKAEGMARSVGNVGDYYLERQNDLLADNIATWGNHRDLIMRTDEAEESVRLARLESLRQSALQALAIQNQITRSSQVDIFG